MPDIDDVLRQVQKVSTTVRICLDGGLSARHERLQEELLAALRADEAEQGVITRAPAVAEQIQELEAQIAKAEVEFTFTAISRRAWTNLEVAHAATPEQQAQGNTWNPETFPVAVVAACCSEPAGVTVEKAGLIADTLSTGQWMKLWRTCLAVNLDGETPFSEAASAVLRVSATRPAQPGTTGSLAASS